MKRARKPSAKPGATRKRGIAKPATLSVRVVEARVPYLEVRISEPINEKSMVRQFERVRGEVLRRGAKQLLVDGRQSSVVLSVSDMHTLAKLVAGAFAGALECLALVLRPQDIPAEKFFEPAVTHRGLPTLVTADVDEAVYWLTARIKPSR